MLTMRAQLAGNLALRHIKEVQNEWKVALLTEASVIQKEYYKTTSTWKHRQEINFWVSAHFGPVRWWVDVQTRHRIYWFVHESVSVMRGVLSSDWSPKTQPRVLGSGQGSGRLLYASKKVSLPPYEPRKFTQAIIKERQPKFQKAMEKATRDGVKNIP